MFQVVVWVERYPMARCRTIGEFPTYREARRACRRALLRYHAGLVPCLPEVTRFEPGFMASLGQPTAGNYGRVVCNDDGYQVSFTPCQEIQR